MRTFESKEGLFQHAIDQQFKLWDMLKADRAQLGENAKERAGVVAAFLFGLTFMTHLLEGEPFNMKDKEKIQKLAAPLIQSLIDAK